MIRHLLKNVSRASDFVCTIIHIFIIIIILLSPHRINNIGRCSMRQADQIKRCRITPLVGYDDHNNNVNILYTYICTTYL